MNGGLGTEALITALEQEVEMLKAERDFAVAEAKETRRIMFVMRYSAPTPSDMGVYQDILARAHKEYITDSLPK